MTDLFDQASLLQRAEALVAAAKKAGADAADAFGLRGVSQDVSWREGRVEGSERSEGDDVGLRVFVGRKSATISSNDPREDVHDVAARAMTIAKAAPDDPFAGLADPALLAKDFPDLDVLDRTMPTVAQLEAWAAEAEEAALAVKGISKSGGASASTGLTGLVLVTSHGFVGQSLASHSSIAMTAVAGEGTAMQRDYDYCTMRHVADLKSPSAIGRLAAERTVARLNPRKIDTQKAPVMFDRRIASSFVNHLLGAINGQSIARKTSFLREKMGASLFKPSITIIDDPLRRRGLASRAFDAEGGRREKRALIDKGVLTTWLLDSTTGRELGLPSTGHAQRSAGSAPSPSASNVHMAAGALSPHAMLKEMGTGLFVTDFIGHGANLVTGHYSRGCSGYWVENGELAYPVAEITLAGDLLSMFASLEAANDLEFLSTHNAPSVRIEGLTIAGR